MHSAARIVIAAGLLAAAGAVHAQELKVDEIIRRANRVSYYQGKDGRAQVRMEIVDAQGRKRLREMTILRRDDPAPEGSQAKKDEFCGNQRFYVRFHRPADVNKMSFLVWKNLEKDDDRWLYLPALDLVKRISSADKRTSFVGSNFFYEDVSGRHIDADEHELVETTKNYFVIKSTPRKSGEVEFAHYKMWIHRKTFLVIKVEYYDGQDHKYRVYEALGVQTIQGFPTVTKARMSDLRTKGYTVAEYSDVTYDIGLPADIFTERYLRRAPRKYLR